MHITQDQSGFPVATVSTDKGIFQLTMIDGDSVAVSTLRGDGHFVGPFVGKAMFYTVSGHLKPDGSFTDSAIYHGAPTLRLNRIDPPVSSHRTRGSVFSNDMPRAAVERVRKYIEPFVREFATPERRVQGAVQQARMRLKYKDAEIARIQEAMDKAQAERLDLYRNLLNLESLAEADSKEVRELLGV